MIKAIFYTRFHPEKGPRVLYQVPEGSIVTPSHPQPSSIAQPLFDFHSISDLLIPRQEFCDRLVTVCVNHYRVLGYPVCIENSRYYRNQFIFNLAVVLDEDADFSGHASIVRKLASLFRNLEEQSRFLSKEEEEVLKPKPAFLHPGPDSPMRSHMDDGADSLAVADSEDEAGVPSLSNSIVLGAEASQSTKVYALCEMIMEDLNNYCECKIPIDDANTIDLKLFQPRPPPAPVYAWHVPLATVQLTSIPISSDLTLTRILPYIDGVSSVAQISQQADTDLNLTRKAIAHLLYYRCVLLLDIFQFSAVYAPTAEMGAFVEDDDAQEEALRYVSVGQYRRLTEREASNGGGGAAEQWAVKGKGATIEKTRLLSLYASLRQGLTLRDWCIKHGVLLAGVDVRRLITFGVIKGFLYRVHKYAILGSQAGEMGTNTTAKGSSGAKDFADPEAAQLEIYAATGREGRRGSDITLLTEREISSVRLSDYLDGTHCFDEICTELQLSEKQVVERIKGLHGDVQFIYR